VPEPYDAVLVVSFGGPEKQEDVIPFLENVLRGRNVPRERMLEVAEHYKRFGGASPINAQTRRLIHALEALLAGAGVQLPVYWGNRNWHPLLSDTVRRMRDDGVRRAVAFVTSAWSSYSSCRQYLENIEHARAQCGDDAPRIDKLRVFYNHPGFIEATADRVAEAFGQVPASRRDTAELIFTAHSIPLAMAEGCDYESQLREACRLVAERLARTDWRLVYQSRSGPASQPWLEPDICRDLADAARRGAGDVVVVPIGFLSDHMEVIYDLDYEARRVCEAHGLSMVRSETVGSHPRFVSMIHELIMERIDPTAPRRAVGKFGPGHDRCPDGCCPRSTTRETDIGSHGRGG